CQAANEHSWITYNGRKLPKNRVLEVPSGAVVQFEQEDYIAVPKDFKAVFGRPDQVIAMIENAVLSFVVLHDHTLWKKEP
ncbi:MAG: hypothetical protein NXI02_29420, partial [Rhodobacteraceae bacterium]|nr:hypothetical protein [Paracoccaceae bacterium]